MILPSRSSPFGRRLKPFIFGCSLWGINCLRHIWYPKSVHQPSNISTLQLSNLQTFQLSSQPSNPSLSTPKLPDFPTPSQTFKPVAISTQTSRLSDFRTFGLLLIPPSAETYKIDNLEMVKSKNFPISMPILGFLLF